MVSFWAKKHGNDPPESQHDPEHDDDDEQNQSYHQDPTERTSLLPREDGHNLLSPDDPAVGALYRSSRGH